MKKDKRNLKAADDVDDIIKAMNYELAGEIGVISPGDKNLNKNVINRETKKGKRGSSLKKKI